jgi:hypothetical protein
MSAGSSNGQSSSSGYGYSTNLAQSVNSSTQNVWGGQSGALTNLYGQAQGQAARGVDPSISGASAGGVGALSKIAGGTTPLDGFADPSSSAGKAMMDSIAAGVGDKFNKVILPGLTSAAGQAGALGGSRDGLAKGVAASDAQSQIMQAAYGQAAQAAAGKTDAMLSAGTALPSAALQQYGLSWAPLGQLAGILGGPTVLGNSMGVSQAGGQSENWNSSKSSQSASNFGFNFF